MSYKYKKVDVHKTSLSWKKLKSNIKGQNDKWKFQQLSWLTCGCNPHSNIVNNNKDMSYSINSNINIF